jgi:hypothetical protein
VAEMAPEWSQKFQNGQALWQLEFASQAQVTLDNFWSASLKSTTSITSYYTYI